MNENLYITRKGKDLVKKWEGYREEAYLCPADVWTIGWGHTDGVKKGLVISPDTAEEFLELDLKEAGNYVKKYVKVPLNINQYNALASFVFNLGPGNFRKSTLLKKLNKGDYKGAADEFDKWVYAGKQVLLGLVKRRLDEKKLFLKPDYSKLWRFFRNLEVKFFEFIRENQ